MTRATILCVFADEQPQNRTADALDRAGFTVERVATVDAALDRLDGADCLVLGEPSVEAVETVGERQPSLPVVCYPADGGERLAADLLGAGATDYLPRDGPDTTDELIERVERATPREADEHERFRALIEHSTDMLAILGPEGTFEYVSPSVERILGYQPEELVGENAFEWVHEEDRDDVVGKFFDAVEDPTYRPTAEYRFEDADGEWRYLESRGKNRLDDPAVEGFVVNSRDITERRKREQELRTERALTEGILHTIPDTVYAFDHEGTPVQEGAILNDGLVGYSREEIIENHPLEFVPEEDREELETAISEVLEEGGVRTYESALVSKDGERIPHEFNGARLTDEDGEILGLVGTARDITERIERERELKRQNERLEEFAAVVSHDIRNPLNLVLGHADMAASADDPEPHLAAIETAADRMATLVDDLLSLAQQGQTIGDLQPVALADVAQEAWETVDTAAATLTVDDLGVVQGDSARIHELFTNLFQNAVEHGSPTVSVQVRAIPDGFVVADDGPGIPPEERDAVLENGYTTAEGGTGLGLAIVQQVVEAHGWSLHVAESDEDGARFEVTGVGGTDTDGAASRESTV